MTRKIVKRSKFFAAIFYSNHVLNLFRAILASARTRRSGHQDPIVEIKVGDDIGMNSSVSSVANARKRLAQFSVALTACAAEVSVGL